MANFCKECNKEILDDKKYCSAECYYKRKKPIKICEGCGKEFNPSHKTTKYCSIKCSSLYKDYDSQVNTLKNTMLNKYGVDYPSQLEDHAKKVKKTKKDRYGNENYTNSQKMKKTLLEKYGDENYVNVEKNKQTKFERYGNPNYNNREKFINTLVTTYGEKIHPNTKQNIIERAKSGEIGFKSKKYKEYLKKNNISNVSQIEEIKNKKSKNNLYDMFYRLFNSDRLKNMVTPLFNIDEYAGIEKKYKFQCNECKNIFEDNMYAGKIPRCLNCYPIGYGKSMGQKELYNYICSIYNGNVLYNVKEIPKSRLEFDIYIPDKKIAFEFNGVYWHSELSGKSKKYHLDKTKLAEKHGIHLIHIFDDDWINKNNIIKSKIYNLLTHDHLKIYARKCVIREININHKSNFLHENHIQGDDNSSIRLGAYHKDELIAVMTFGKPRKALGYNGGDFYELIRFATSKKVIGIGGKLLKYFIRNYNPIKIITYADRCWTTELEDNLYIKLGFSKVSETSPNYWYIVNGNKVHRFNFRKNVLPFKLKTFDPILTEWENMQLNGYNRIWDCGNYKYELNI